MRSLYPLFILVLIVACAGFTSTAFAQSCPCTIWSQSTVPGSVDGGDPAAGEYGLKFQTSTNGYIFGIRFYKSAANTGTHVGNLWSNSGALLASAVFTNESVSGWQQVTFSSPVAVTAGVTYVASYFTPSGHYSFNGDFFTSNVVSGPLVALADGADGPNAVYAYGSSSSFPTSTYGASNYWVDVVFDTTLAPKVVSFAPSGLNVALSVPVTATFSEPVDPSTVNSTTFELLDGNNAAVSAAVTYNAGTQTATLQPSVTLLNATSIQLSWSVVREESGI